MRIPPTPADHTFSQVRERPPNEIGMRISVPEAYQQPTPSVFQGRREGMEYIYCWVDLLDPTVNVLHGYSNRATRSINLRHAALGRILTLDLDAEGWRESRWEC